MTPADAGVGRASAAHATPRPPAAGRPTGLRRRGRRRGRARGHSIARARRPRRDLRGRRRARTRRAARASRARRPRSCRSLGDRPPLTDERPRGHLRGRAAVAAARHALLGLGAQLVVPLAPTTSTPGLARPRGGGVTPDGRRRPHAARGRGVEPAQGAGADHQHPPAARRASRPPRQGRRLVYNA